MFRPLTLSRLAVLVVLVPAFAGVALGIEAWEVLDAEERNRQAEELGRELDAAGVEIGRRIEAKEALIRELIAGRITLREATARFLALDRGHEDIMQTVRDRFPGATDEEKMARNALSFVDTALHPRPPRAAAEVRSRLAAELDAMTLPGSSPPG